MEIFDFAIFDYLAKLNMKSLPLQGVMLVFYEGKHTKLMILSYNCLVICYLLAYAYNMLVFKSSLIIKGFLFFFLIL